VLIMIFSRSAFIKRRSPLQSLRAMPRATQGLAAIEFGFSLPFFLLALFGFIEITRYVIATRQLEYAANSISEMLSRTQTMVTNADVNLAFDSLMVEFPLVLNDAARKGVSPWRNDISVSMNSIAFAPTVAGCTSNCTYEAKVAWSAGSAGARRPCGTPLASTPDVNTPTPTTLPADTFGPSALVAVDLSFSYAPLYGSQYIKPITIKRSSFLQARYVPANSYLKYDASTGTALVATCPGY
jgi:Flp pilus assembly protein TadG